MLFEGPLSTIVQFDEMGFSTSPTAWWPKDRQWVVYTDWDLSFTVIAGSAELDARLNRSRELEIVRVAPETRIDDGADDINSQS